MILITFSDDIKLLACWYTIRDMADELFHKVTTFFSQFKRQTFNKGEILIRADDEPLGIYFLISGEVKQYSISVSGEESNITIFKPSAYFPMSWAVTKNPNKYYFEAMTEVEALRAPADKVITFLKQNPDVLFDLLKRLYVGLDGLTERMTYLMSGTAYQRVIVELLIGMKRLSKKIVKNNHTYWELHISEKDLAALTGLTRETVSRELKVLKEKKILNYERTLLQINNIDLLKNELAEII